MKPSELINIYNNKNNSIEDIYYESMKLLTISQIEICLESATFDTDYDNYQTSFYITSDNVADLIFVEHLNLEETFYKQDFIEFCIDVCNQQIYEIENNGITRSEYIGAHDYSYYIEGFDEIYIEYNIKDIISRIRKLKINKILS